MPDQVDDSVPDQVDDAVPDQDDAGQTDTSPADTSPADTSPANSPAVAAPADSPAVAAPADSPAVAAPADSPAVAAPRRGWFRRHKMLTGVFATAVAGILVVGATNIWVRADASAHTFRTADAPTAPIALVLGAGLLPDGTPSQYLRDRLDDAVTLFRSGTVRALLVSGDNGTTTHDEPTAMMEYLVAHGVPAAQVVRDYAGFDTYDSCLRAKKIFGVTRALVVTQEFHLPRAVFLCRQVGIDAEGAADPHPGGVRAQFVLREVPGSVKAAWDAIWQPDPKFLGPFEPALGQAAGG